MPSTPQISLAREHCSYFGAYCRNGDIKQEHCTADVASNLQETNDSRSFGSWAHGGLQSETTFSDSIPISGSIKVSTFSFPFSWFFDLEKRFSSSSLYLEKYRSKQMRILLKELDIC